MTSKRKVRNPLSVLRHRKKHPSNNNNNNNTTISRSNNKPRIYNGHDTNTYMMSMPTTTNPSLQVQFEKPSNSSSIVVLLEPRSSSSSSLGVATSCISKNHIINYNEKETAKTSCAANDENDNFIYNDENGEDSYDAKREKSHKSLRFVVVEESLTVEEEDDSVHSNTNNNDEDEDDYKVLTPTKTTTCTTNSPFSPIQDVIKQTVFDLAGSYKEGHCLFYLTRLTRLLVNHQRESITEYSVSAPASSTTTTTTTRRRTNVQHMNIIEEEEEEEIEDDDNDTPRDSNNISKSSKRRLQKSLSATQSPFENNTTIHSTTSTEEETKTLIQVMIDNGLISTLISVMGRHHMNVHILSLSFKLLGKLGEHNECNEIQIVQQNGIQIIIQTLSQHMTNHMLCLEACSTLYKVLHCISATHSSQKIVLRQMLITTSANRGPSHPHEELTSTSAREPSCSSQMKLKQSHTSNSTLVPDCTAGIEVLRRVMLLHMKHPSIQQHVLSVLCLFAVMIMARNDWNHHHHHDDQQQQQQQQHMTTAEESKSLSSNSSIALSKLLISSMEDIALIEVIMQVMRRYGSSFFSNNTNCTSKRRTGNRLLSLNCGHYYSYHHHSQLVIQSSVLQLGNKLLHCLLLASKQRELTISKINNDIGRYYYGRRKDSNRTKALFFFNDGYIRSSSKQLVQYLLRSRCCVLFLQIIHKHHEHITKSMKLLKNHDRPTSVMNRHGENRRGGYCRTRSKTSDPLLILYTKDISTMKQSLDSIYILAEYNPNEVRKQLSESPVSVVTTVTTDSHRNKQHSCNFISKTFDAASATPLGDNPIDHQSQQQYGVTNYQRGLNIATINQNRRNRRRYHHQHGVSTNRSKRKEMSGLLLLKDIASGNNDLHSYSIGVQERATKILSHLGEM